MMLPEVRDYLENVRTHLHLDPLTERQVISELYTYFQEKVAELQQSGLPVKDAARTAVESLGRARVVARLMYESCCKGSWVDAIIAALPHFIIAGLFITGLWHHHQSTLIAFAAIACITSLGWWHGKPNWLYTWVGYALATLLIAGYITYPVLVQAASFLLWQQGTFPVIWKTFLVLALFAFTLLVIVRATIRVVRRDWVLASLMLVPLPILGSWLSNIGVTGGALRNSETMLHQWDTTMALAFVVLGITSTIFIRLRQRLLKVGAVVIVGSIALAMVGHNLWGGLSFFGLLGLFVLMLAFLFTPALIETGIGHGEQRRETWWRAYQTGQYLTMK